MLRKLVLGCLLFIPYVLLAQIEEMEPDTSFQDIFGEVFILGDSLLLEARADSGSIMQDSLAYIAQFEASFYFSDSVYLYADAERFNVFNERFLQQPPSVVSVEIEKLVDYSLTFVGLPYRFGGTTENGFDCSGFVRHVYGKHGLSLPRSSREQVLVGSEVSLDAVQKGDLLFFKGRNAKSPRIGHVALVIEVGENKDVKMIHSTRHGLRADWLSEEPYYRKRYVTARRPDLKTQ
ncbi:MAG TPA: C40 family peptidase [Bacteroidales bacterium]|nr:C40 family peptidase [Bacteroidales bacterium]HQQ11770.1 C40 family peptidase [Bacteroidales bacterium]